MGSQAKRSTHVPLLGLNCLVRRILKRGVWEKTEGVLHGCQWSGCLGRPTRYEGRRTPHCTCFELDRAFCANFAAADGFFLAEVLTCALCPILAPLASEPTCECGSGWQGGLRKDRTLRARWEPSFKHEVKAARSSVREHVNQKNTSPKSVRRRTVPKSGLRAR